MSSARYEYEKARNSAAAKAISCEDLKQSEKIALSGLWYFTTTLPIDFIEKIVEQAESSGVKPHEIVNAWIMRGRNGKD